MLRLLGGLRARARRDDGLFVDGIRAIPGDENAGGGRDYAIRADISLIVQVDRPFEKSRLRDVPDGDKGA